MKIVNIRTDYGEIKVAIKNGDYVRIDRKTRWGNPFSIGKDGTREEVIEKYLEYILGNEGLMDALPELEGKILGCWCVPKPCHGDILRELCEM